METFQEAGVQMLKEFRALLQHSPLPLPGNRLLQLLALNMFAIETTQLKGKSKFVGIYRCAYNYYITIIAVISFAFIKRRCDVSFPEPNRSPQPHQTHLYYNTHADVFSL